MEIIMANDLSISDGNKEHQLLSTYIKDVHSGLRIAAADVGAEKAWEAHCQNEETLKKYAKFMEKLATKHWINNESQSRISWAADFCIKYFRNKEFLIYNDKEQVIVEKINIKIDCTPSFDGKIKLLDVGSCYNPFSDYENIMDVTAIDLCPANESVLYCDILDVNISHETIIKDRKVIQLQEQSYDAIIFSFLLEYIPSSELRILACSKAYSLLKTGGLLLICTPDSKHVGANAKLMKGWRYTLSQIGFNRIHYSKYKYIHCMAFRKCIDKNISKRWADLHKESYMEFAINIPQDFNKLSDEISNLSGSQEYSGETLKEMPFFDTEL